MNRVGVPEGNPTIGFLIFMSALLCSWLARAALAKSIADGRGFPRSTPGPDSSGAGVITLEAVNLDTSGELGLVPVTSTARPIPADEVGIFKPVDLGITTGRPGPGPLTFPPIASKRWTMSVIEVRRTPCLRGLSSGTDRPVGFGGVSVFPSEVDFDIGKASIDCGLTREDEGVLPDEGVFAPDACFM